MNRPVCIWVPKFHEAETYALVPKGTSWELGKIALRSREQRVTGKNWLAILYMREEDGTYLCDTKEAAKDWLTQQVTEEFAKMTECQK